MATAREDMIFTLHHCYGWSTIDLYKMSVQQLTKIYNNRAVTAR